MLPGGTSAGEAPRPASQADGMDIANIKGTRHRRSVPALLSFGEQAAHAHPVCLLESGHG